MDFYVIHTNLCVLQRGSEIPSIDMSVKNDSNEAVSRKGVHHEQKRAVICNVIKLHLALIGMQLAHCVKSERTCC